MKNSMPETNQLVAESYIDCHDKIVWYIFRKIGNYTIAEDLAQDAFMRLLKYKHMLRKETIQSFLYTITRNIVVDYLRHHYKTQEAYSYIYDATPAASNESEEQVIVNNLLSLEQHRLSLMPKQRKCIYIMKRFEDKSVPEIADELNLSRRSVENHLSIGRKEMRSFLSECI